MILRKSIVTLGHLSVLFLVSCASGHSHRNQEVNASGASPSDHMLVFKADGSLQCQMGTGTPVDAMAKTLTAKGITVYSSENRHDGLMHIQACGTPTGMINVYEISKNRLEDALELGFKKYDQNWQK